MTAAATKQKSAPASAAPVKARELMEELNADAGKLNIWVRTEFNAPANAPGSPIRAAEPARGNWRRAASQPIRSRRCPSNGAGTTTPRSWSASNRLPSGPTSRRSNLPIARAFS